MNRKDLYNGFNEVDDDILERSETACQTKKKTVWPKWGAVAACLCLVVVGAINLLQNPTNPSSNPELPAPAVGFRLEGSENVLYFPISFESRERFGLTATGNSYQVTESDCGEYMGTISISADESLVGCKVYHYVKYPHYTAVCVVEYGDRYYIYVAEDGIELADEIGQSSNVGLDAYKLPESIEKIEVLTSDLCELHLIEDPEKLSQLFNLLAGKENIGNEAYQRIYAQIWFDAYGNNDVYYSEEHGCCKFKNDDVKRTAHALWGENERLLRINTNEGFQFYIHYHPATSSVLWGDAIYILTETEVHEINKILSIPATGDVIDTPTDDIITDMAYPNLNLETLKDIVESAGNNLTWADFSPYYSEEIGSGLYILRYPIDIDYCLMIGGGSMDTSPMYIRLASEYDSENYIDVRTDNIDDFVNTTPKTTSFSYDEVLKTYQENDPGVKYDGFSNTSRTAIENINDVIEQAKNECTVSYTMVNASYDSNNRMWAVLFWSGTPGGGQTVYMDCYGVTSLVVYGE